MQVYAGDAYTLPGNSAILTCLVLPVEQAWAVQVTHWTAGSGQLVDSQSIPPGKSLLFILSIRYFGNFFVPVCIVGSKYAIIDGHLHVADVTVEDTRLDYRCYVRHRLLAIQPQTAVSSPPARIVLTPDQQPLPTAPHQLAPLRTSLTIRHARLGQDQVYISCPVLSYPPAKTRYLL